MTCEKCRKYLATVHVTHTSPPRTRSYCIQCSQEDPFAPKQGRIMRQEVFQELKALEVDIESLRHAIEEELQAEH